jgi:hypothetical protein
MLLRHPVPLLFVLLPLLASGWVATRTHQASGAGEQQSSSAAAPSGEALAGVLCVACHALPSPSILPKRTWRDQIARMWLILNKLPEPTAQGAAARAVTFPPDWETVVRYYEANAPESLDAPPVWPAVDRRLAWRRRTAAPADAPAGPAVSNVRLVDLDNDGRLELVAGDMRHGVLLVGRPYESPTVLKEIAQVPHPAHIEPVDFDRDGILDLVVGDLGNFMPSDNDRGAVVWLRGRPGGTYAQMSLDGWPPVADVEPGDFNGDGRLDLAVAAFGWRWTGALTILRNDTRDYNHPQFVPFRIEERTGAIHAQVVDINRDARPDIVALFSQEHEMVLAFINTGAGMRFDRQVIGQAPHPAWGSSGIQVVDLDEDGDLDVLWTNGDSFDVAMRKPYHGISWLENRGTYPFVEHRLAEMAGVHRAQAVDLDGDADLDIVACALVSGRESDGVQLPALVWLEQTRPGVFERHTIDAGLPTHATLDAGDFDGDGDIDLLVGNFTSGVRQPAWVEIWENLRRSPAAPTPDASKGTGARVP